MSTPAAESRWQGPQGTMRVRTVGTGGADKVDVVAVQGMGVADYLMPALAHLGDWCRAHLLELPGLTRAGRARRRLDLADYAAAVSGWIDDRTDLGPLVVAGHSSGTQIAAHAAGDRRDVSAVVLASPTVDPVARSWPKLTARWWWNARHEAGPGLTASHLPEWAHTGPTRLRRLAALCLADRLEETVEELDVPVLVLRGAGDRLCTEHWARSLATANGPVEYKEMPGAHTFVWSHPDAWTEPVRAFARRVPTIT